MKDKITVGIPRALLYFKHKVLWCEFFTNLGCEVVLSSPSNKKILEDGIYYSIDECCLSSKLYMGHVKDLINKKVDYIFVPRVANYGKKEKTCTKFHGIYDVVQNTFPDIKLLNYNLDVLAGEKEINGFIKLGLNFTKNLPKISKAYYDAKKAQKLYDENNELKQESMIKDSKKNKILLISHPYNTYDTLIGMPVVKYLEKLNVSVVYSDRLNEEIARKNCEDLSSTIYWTYNKELIGSIDYYKGIVDGIIFLTTFPCGPDSLVTELCIRKLKHIPIINIVIDELQGEAGLHTRLESFIDIIDMKKKKRAGGSYESK